MVRDPEQEPERWDEPIIADNPQRARQECQRRAEQYGVDVEKSSAGLSLSLQGERLMSVLNCVKPGAKPGQVILAVDLSVSGNPNETIDRLQKLGYDPQIRHIAYTTGVHVFAVLKDEYPSDATEDYLLDEWMQLCTDLNSNAVHLWHGTLKR